jgi:hypothetical protein
MVRRSKVARDRSVSYKRPSRAGKKTGPLQETLPLGYKEHANALTGDVAAAAFIPKIK